MPFVKKSRDLRGEPLASGSIFVGRVGELQFFTEQILKLEDPAYNIISIYGNGGVGKSTFLSRLLDEIHAPAYRSYCMAAFVDERQATPASLMEKLADQLHLVNFKKAVVRYRQAVRRQQSEEETMDDAVLRHAPDLAGAAVEGIPFVGPILGQSVKIAAAHMAHNYRVGQTRDDAEHLEHPIADLTKTFVKELNQLAETLTLFEGSGTRRRRRVLLFFDTFEQLAEEVAPWLLDYLLPAEISSDVVLVIAGRVSLDRSLPNDPKRWMPYYDRHEIYTISLNSFTEKETRTYLAQRAIREPTQVETIWRLSRGLPLYLSMLTSHPNDTVDPTSDVVANFLRWIPTQETLKRRLVLDAALFSRPFNQDDLAAFSYLNEQERSTLYHWLLTQPFVRQNAQDGRYLYHEVAKEQFSRYLYQSSPETYLFARQALARYYCAHIDALESVRGTIDEYAGEWSALSLAAAHQLFLLPDQASHADAAERVLTVYTVTKEDEEVTRLLRDMTEDQLYNHASADTRQWATLLLAYIEAEPMSLDLLAAGNALMQKIATAAQFSREQQARIHNTCGIIYRSLSSYQSALEEFSQAISDDATYAVAYGNRGITYRAMKQYKDALGDFNMALQRDEKLDWVYAGRGEVYRHLKEYEQAINDFDHALTLDPAYAAAYAGRGRVRRLLHQYERAIDDFNRALTLDPELDWAYAQRAEAYRGLRQYAQALADYTTAIALDSNGNYFWAYGSRGLIYFLLNRYEEAINDYNTAIQLNDEYTWCYAARGRTYYHLRQYEQAVADYNRAIALDPQNDWIYSHRGLTYLAQQQYERAIEDFTRAIRLNPTYGRTYGRRGSAYLGLHNYVRAAQDFAHNCQLFPPDVLACWMGEWVQLCQQANTANEELAQRLEEIAGRDNQHYLSYLCHAVVCWLRGDLTQAQLLAEEVLHTRPTMWDGYFWQGVFACWEGQHGGVVAIERALAMGMFPALLAPLHLLEQQQPVLYEKEIAPLLVRYGISNID